MNTHLHTCKLSCQCCVRIEAITCFFSSSSSLFCLFSRFQTHRVFSLASSDFIYFGNLRQSIKVRLPTNPCTYDVDSWKIHLHGWTVGNKALELHVGTNSASDSTCKVFCLLLGGGRIMRTFTQLRVNFTMSLIWFNCYCSADSC